MRAFKIDNLLRDHPGVPLPHFMPLADSEACALLQKLALKSDRPDGTARDVTWWLSQRATSLAGIDLDQSQVCLTELFERSNIVPSAAVYVQWSPKEIDRFQTEDLGAYFYDVWYPSADDIEIFDDSLSWMMFIRHYGGVEIWRAGEKTLQPMQLRPPWPKAQPAGG